MKSVVRSAKHLRYVSMSAALFSAVAGGTF